MSHKPNTSKALIGGLANGLIDTEDLHLNIRLEDVETLNRLCGEKSLDVTKISIAALAYSLDDYALLPPPPSLPFYGKTPPRFAHAL